MYPQVWQAHLYFDSISYEWVVVTWTFKLEKVRVQREALDFDYESLNVEKDVGIWS